MTAWKNTPLCLCESRTKPSCRAGLGAVEVMRSTGGGLEGHGGPGRGFGRALLAPQMQTWFSCIFCTAA